jgi:crotonobetainyl-CoA:carnitine CoA-transferase CaiB-like acyl-CoA transferase
MQASDGQWIILGVGSDNIWRKFCDLAGLEALRDDPRYATNAERVRNRDALLPQVRAVVRSRPAAEWMTLLQENGIPTGPIRTVEEALADPQLAARNFVVELEHPALGVVKSLATPIHFSGDGVAYRRHPPLLGEQTDEVLAELGLSAQEIAGLRSRGVV